MASTFICDGCGKPVDSPVIVGHVVKRDYCEACAEVARSFVDAEEKLRADLVENFRDARLKMIEEAGAFKLPDVPQ